ncbi:MAG: hypothetical protein HOW73_26475 [Polyangiaceae bacterium]|nr:hypothetical protein [Polyangiaceae bacterium]
MKKPLLESVTAGDEKAEDRRADGWGPAPIENVADCDDTPVTPTELLRKLQEFERQLWSRNIEYLMRRPRASVR